MEIQGRIINVALPTSGTSSRGEWTSQDYVIETEDRYPRKMCFNIFGEDKIREANIQVGDKLKVHFDIDAREYQGRWYNSIRAWKVERPGQAYQQSAPMTQQAPPPPVGMAPKPEDNSLPF